MKHITSRTTAIVAGAAVLVLVGGVGGAGAVSLITGAQIMDQTIHSNDIAAGGVGSSEIRNGNVTPNDLSATTKALLGQDGANGTNGKDGAKGATGAPGEDGKDGKDGVTDLNAGAGYNHTWPGDNGAALQTIVAKCDPGQQALSGGFSTWGGSDTNESGLAYDLGGDNKAIQVTVSAPYTGEAYDETKYHGGILPDRWVVKGYNNSGTEQIVRAWVVCANVSAN